MKYCIAILTYVPQNVYKNYKIILIQITILTIQLANTLQAPPNSHVVRAEWYIFEQFELLKLHNYVIPHI